MATYVKANSSAPIVNGAAYVKPKMHASDPASQENRVAGTQVYSDIDQLGWVVNLDDRFLIAPSGWNS